jgi:hypothetical protein
MIAANKSTCPGREAGFVVYEADFIVRVKWDTRYRYPDLTFAVENYVSRK